MAAKLNCCLTLPYIFVFRGHDFLVNLDSMTIYESLEFDQIRRLSTPSTSGTASNYHTVWKYYCRDHFGWREYSEVKLLLLIKWIEHYVKMQGTLYSEIACHTVMVTVFFHDSLLWSWLRKPIAVDWRKSGSLHGTTNIYWTLKMASNRTLASGRKSKEGPCSVPLSCYCHISSK